MKLTRILSALAIIFVTGSLIVHAESDGRGKRRNVRVMVITMFEIAGPFAGETQNWIDKEGLTEEIKLPGLSANFPSVFCKPLGSHKGFESDKEDKNDKDRGNTSDECVITTDIGYANAASSITALLLSDQFDFKNTYFLIAGIAGVDPADGTLGSAAWARYSIDYGLAHEIDAREMPAGWPYGYTGFGPVPPDAKPTRTIGTEVYQLNEALLQKALNLTKDLTLTDGDAAKAYRALYPNPPANQPPKVIQCDTAAIDTYWHGAILSQRANNWAKLLTDGAANYCMTDEEDNATLTALKRGANAGLLDFNRVALLRTASNFDQPHPGQTAYESLTTRSGGFVPSVTNAYLVGSTLTHAIIGDWKHWKAGVPADAPLTVNPK